MANPCEGCDRKQQTPSVSYEFINLGLPVVNYGNQQLFPTCLRLPFNCSGNNYADAEVWSLLSDELSRVTLGCDLISCQHSGGSCCIVGTNKSYATG